MKKSENQSAPELQKKEYVRPKLTLYGSIAKLTQATGSVNGDAGQNMMP